VVQRCRDPAPTNYDQTANSRYCLRGYERAPEKIQGRLKRAVTLPPDRIFFRSRIEVRSRHGDSRVPTLVPERQRQVREPGGRSLSAVAPQWAALTAVLNQALKKKAGFFIPLLYANSKAATTNDIAIGNNSVFGVAGFSAKPGWDACTGFGSPNGAKLSNTSSCAIQNRAHR